MVATSATLHAAGSPRDTSSTLRELDDQARESAPLYRSRLAGDFLHAVSRLPTVAPRTVLFDSSRVHYWTSGQAAALPDSQRARLISRELGESFYYNTRYGTPLAYARPLELLAKAGFTRVAGRRLADFGYGGIGQLRLLATLGAEVTGIEVDPLLRALYSWPNDQGQIAGAKPPGSLSLVSGQWPAAPELVREVGNGYDLFISKNTLKNGYLHPAEPVDPRRLVHLGVEDSTFAAALYRVLRPGGWAMIYNLCPAPAPPGMPYIPWADGRCPFSRAMLEAAGFQVVAFDADDSPAARRMGHALGWDDPDGAKMDLEHDLFATYTLLRRPPKP
ncbi:MAG TPA: hypothetical protein VMJ70_00435 [Candidatus Sulfotelmatobacter sp.]|nr:hypothetical protein [Candidatus Sulfotelmatobacter sp.]